MSKKQANRTTRRRVGAPKGRRLAVAVMLVAGALGFSPTDSLADLVESLDQGKLNGELTITDGMDLVITPQDGEPVKLKLEDVESIKLGKQLVSLDGDMLVINNDGGLRNVAILKAVQLRAGLHRFVIPFWQANGQSKLNVSVAGPGISGQQALDDGHMYCFRVHPKAHEPSGGIDEQGYRLPELELKSKDNRRLMQARCRYRLYADDDGEIPFQNVGVLSNIPLKREGTTTELGTGFVHDYEERFGLVLEGFFVAPKDGKYTFGMQCDDGAQLYLGEAKSFVVDALGATPVHAPWSFTLHHGGSARGELKQIGNGKAFLHIPLVSDASISTAQIKEMWVAKTKAESIDRDKIEPGTDTAYIKDKNDASKVIAFSGKLISIDDKSLSFEFRGKARNIDRGRVVGLVLGHADRPKPADPGFYQLAKLRGGQLLPCRFVSLDKHARFELIGGDTLAPPRDVLMALRCENGRRVDLTRVTPTAEEAVPYFGAKIPSRVNRSFADKPIKLFDEKVYERGLAVHSKSRLHYKLQRPAEKFQARFGLLNPGGRLGQVTARVLGDGKVLWEQENIDADTKPIDITVELKGVKRLVLEVDFGQGQNVGDRAAWCDPQLIYAASQEQ